MAEGKKGGDRWIGVERAKEKRADGAEEVKMGQ